MPDRPGNDARVVLVGATGYTGTLVARELARQGVPRLLTARDPAKLDRLGGATRVVDVTDEAALRDAIRPGDVVINCAGPFTELGEPVVRAAVEAAAHYLDTTGEQPYMRRIHARWHDAARRAGVAVVNAMAFEYAPGDAAAARVAEGLTAPLDSLHVIYGMAGSGASRGTRRTMVRMVGRRGYVRVDGEWTREPIGARRRPVRLPGDRIVHAFSFPSGEVLTVPRHTPVRNVRGWIVAGPGVVALLRVLAPVLPVLARAVRPLAEAALRRAADGPSEERRRRDGFTIVVEATDADGATRRGVVEGRDPYGLTAAIIVLGARACLDGPPATGVLAPSQLVPHDTLFDALDDVEVEVHPG